MKAITIAHTRHYHLKYGTVGHVWQGRFKSPIVSTDNYLLTLMCYIERNPVRAGIVDHPSKYPFSSYYANARIDKDDLVDKEENPTFIGLGRTPAERIMQYKRIIAAPVQTEMIELIKKSLGGQSHFSSDEYLSNVLASPQGDTKRRPGRPKTK
jgi:putative transposase